MDRKFSSSIVLGLSAVLLAGCPKKSPQDQIAAAESALRAARDAGARDCVPDQFKSAEEMMARTYRLNDDKDYDKAKETAITTKEVAEVATIEAEKKVADGQCKPGQGAGAAGEGGDGAKLSGGELTEQQVAKELAETKTGEGALGEGLVVKGLNPVYFDYDAAELTPDALQIVTDNSEWMKDRPTVKIQLEGHTDERGTSEYNLALGERRAKAVRDALIRLGIEEARIKTISYGEETPADPGHDDNARSKNRRAEFVVLQ